MQIEFSHYSGCGNDFVIIDDRQEWFPKNSREIILLLCKEVAVDGLILLTTSQAADFQMQFYNSDGTRASMCGNGIRALMRYLIEKQNWKQKNCSIQVEERVLQLEVVGAHIRVKMGRVLELGWNIALEYEGKEWRLHHLDSGVPHLITFVDDVENIDIAKTGTFFRHHPVFQPNGANVNFVDRVNYKIRTFERGVEAETLACGTGVTAAAIALHQLYRIEFPIRLQVRSGEFLEIDYLDDIATMTGPAHFVRDGIFNFNPETLQTTVEFTPSSQLNYV